jgi:hypothetical protein
MDEVLLFLPVPPSPNTRPKSHWGPIHRWVKKAKQEAWFAAVQQHAPTKTPPEKVVIHAIFALQNRRDHDNLVASLKPVLDALKLPGRSPANWRLGCADEKGYFVDDDPAHMTLEVQQIQVDGEPSLSLAIRPAP